MYIYYYDVILHLLHVPYLTTPSAGYYVKVMKKIQDKGEDYVKNEHERLGRILGKCERGLGGEREIQGERGRIILL